MVSINFLNITWQTFKNFLTFIENDNLICPKKITFSLCGPRLATNTHCHVILMCMAFRQTGFVFVFYVDLMILLKVGRVSSIKLKLVAI